MAFNQIPLEPEAGFTRNSELVVGRVINVALSPYLDDKKTRNPEYNSPGDLGKILYSVVYRNKQISLGENAARPAWPIFSFIKQYPVIGELVLIVLGPTTKMNENASAMQAYYFPSYNLWNSPNENAFPNLYEYADFIIRTYEKEGYNYDKNKLLGSNKATPELPKGAYFTSKPIKNLTPFEGDSIIEGRFGQSIRFGSTTTLKKTESKWSNFGPDGAPITIIRNGQGRDSTTIPVTAENIQIRSLPDQPTIENINYDNSSIYLTAGQQIIIDDLTIAGSVFPINSYKGSTFIALTMGVKYTQNRIANESTRTDQLTKNPTSNEINSAKSNDNNTLKQ